MDEMSRIRTQSTDTSEGARWGPWGLPRPEGQPMLIPLVSEEASPPEGSPGAGLPTSHGCPPTLRGECSGASRSRPPDARYGTRGGSGKSLEHEGGLSPDEALGAWSRVSPGLGWLTLGPLGAPNHQSLPFEPHPSPSRPPGLPRGFSPVLRACDLCGPQGLLLWPTVSPQLSQARDGAPWGRSLPPSIRSLAVSRQLCVTVPGMRPATHGAHGPCP